MRGGGIRGLKTEIPTEFLFVGLSNPKLTQIINDFCTTVWQFVAAKPDVVETTFMRHLIRLVPLNAMCISTGVSSGTAGQ